MKIIIFLLIGLALPISLYGQFYSASSFLLQSGVVHGTERERHFSMRLQALGTDFSGYVVDQITDLYRNPAFFHRLERPLLFGELVRQQQIYRPLPISDPRAVVISSSIPASWVGQAKNLGVLLCGNYAKSPSQFGGAGEDFDSHFAEIDNREVRNNWAEAQLVWGFSFRKKFSAGLSYTYGINENRNDRETTESDYESQSFSGNTSTTETRQSSLGNNDHVDQSHILRFGLLWNGARGTSWDAVATLERFAANPKQVSQTLKNQRETASSPYEVLETVNQYEASQTAKLMATNVRLDFRYLNAANPTRTFVAQLGLGVAFFSSTDADDRLSYSRRYSATSSNTSELVSTQRLKQDATPDGFGLQVKGGLGWTFQRNNFLIAVAALGSYRRLKYDDTAREEYTVQYADGFSYTSPGRSYPYDYAFPQYRLALPLGAECQVTPKLHLRAGWVAEFRGTMYEASVREMDGESSIEETSRFSSHRLNFSTVTFGMGYQIFDRLRADLLNFGNLSQPKDWNLAVIYNF